MSKHDSSRPLSLLDDQVLRIATSVKIPNVSPETIGEIVRANLVELREVFEQTPHYSKEIAVLKRARELVANAGDSVKKVLHPKSSELSGSSVGQSNGNKTTVILNYSTAREITRRLAISFLSTKHAKALITSAKSGIVVSGNKTARSPETLALIERFASEGASLLIKEEHQGITANKRTEILNVFFMGILREHLGLSAAEQDESAAPSEGENLDSCDSE
ncbi:MAG: hypothetical protein KBD00_01820 [Candidatus Peribacteraceae bacterium]|nr:hypothetical protein [Candidatus Peribacteraceae bacterium]